MSEVRHAGLIARYSSKGWRGVLIEGPSGAGKSDLAWRARAEGFRLVADDRVVVWASDGRLFGRAPERLAGLKELRGVGVLAEPALRLSEIVMMVRAGASERLPDPVFAEIAGVKLPLIIMGLATASAPVKLGRALSAFDEGPNRGI
ncbi:HPr kinase/phosphorylase [Phenylobacterium immobile]|uniref:HPr kinase/phosphorylase n=1 Tax=Phenylobacterium immobile TaxID=21 RepID=UPI000A66F69B|nr:serine kinase [Phenylobacterium immobile]